MKIDRSTIRFEDFPGDAVLIANDGPRIRETNYWDTEQARRHLYFLTWNAGAARLLLPDSEVAQVAEMATAKLVIVSRGPWVAMDSRDAVELLFDDGSEAPFCLHMVREQCDHMLPRDADSGPFPFVVWTRTGMALERPGRYRTVSALPCLAPWPEHG